MPPKAKKAAKKKGAGGDTDELGTALFL